MNKEWWFKLLFSCLVITFALVGSTAGIIIAETMQCHP